MKHVEGCMLPLKHEGNCDARKPVTLDYTGYNGARRKRKVSPVNLMHESIGWSLGVIDHEDGKHKFFAMRGIHSWKEA